MKICVCSIAINDWYKDVVKYALRNLEMYCQKHSYNYQLYQEETDTNSNKLYDTTRSECWYKILYLIQLMNIYSDYDYFVWVDADIQILKHDVKLEFFIDKYITNKDIN